MFCKKCGRLVEENSRFCGKCGAPIEFINNQVNIDTEKINNNTENNQEQLNLNATENNYTYQNQNYDNIVNPSMKKYAIGCIIVPLISILIYWNIGLSSYVAILLAILGFDFSRKARLNYKTASTIGYILNGILVAMAICMIFVLIIERFG